MPIESRSLQAGHARQSSDGCVACGGALDEAGRCSHCGAASHAGPFDVLGVIAQSARGRVYLAQGPDGRRVALKELVFTSIPSLKALESFRREGEILRTLEHPRIPRFVDAFEEGSGVGKRLYLAQDFVDGQSLATRLQSQRFSVGEAVGIASQVLETVAWLQSRSPAVIHRDVKPANLILRPGGRVELVDFGSARDTPATLGATMEVGTWGYMAPEQLAGEVGPTSDVYGVAATLLALLTRREPRELLAGAGEPGATIRRHLPGEPGLCAWLARALAPRVEARFPDAETALRELDALGLAGSRKVLRIAHVGARSRFGGARIRLVIAASLVLFLAGLVGATVFTLKTVQPSPAPVSASMNPSFQNRAGADENHLYQDVLQRNAFAAEAVKIEGDPTSIDILPDYARVSANASPAQLAEMKRVDGISQTADYNLRAIFLAEQAFKKQHDRYYPFENGDAKTWATLGLELPAEQHHVYSATIRGDGDLYLQATGNLDDDPFMDQWHIDPEMVPHTGDTIQDKSDAIDVDFDVIYPGNGTSAGFPK